MSTTWKNLELSGNLSSQLVDKFTKICRFICFMKFSGFDYKLALGNYKICGFKNSSRYWNLFRRSWFTTELHLGFVPKFLRGSQFLLQFLPRLLLGILSWFPKKLLFGSSKSSYIFFLKRLLRTAPCPLQKVLEISATILVRIQSFFWSFSRDFYQRPQQDFIESVSRIVGSNIVQNLERTPRG